MPYTESPIRQLYFQEVLIDRAAAMSESNKQVRENLITGMLSTMTDEQKETIDRFLSLLCGTGVTQMQLEAEQNCIEIGKNIVSNMNGMDPEQKRSYRQVSGFMDIFVEEMKSRFAKKTLEGRRGFDGEEIVMPVADEIANRLDRMRAGEHNIGVGIANWAFIAWYRQNVLPY